MSSHLYASLKNLTQALCIALPLAAAPLSLADARDVEKATFAQTPGGDASRAGADAGPPQFDTYRLDRGDKLKLRFFERHDREDLNGEYVVSETGLIRLPRLGTFDVRGKTTEEVERDIEKTVAATKQRLGFFSVDLVERRPLYVAGIAAKPGAYAYIPGMTVMHAVSLAGGVQRQLQSGTSIEVMRETTRYVEVLERYKELLGKQARLVAERDGKPLAVPPELEELAPGAAKGLIDQEALILERQRSISDRERTSFEAVIRLTQNEIVSLEQEVAAVRKRRETKNEMLDNMKRLLDRGLANQQRYLEILSAVETVDRDSQLMVAQLARARANLEKAQRDLSMLTLEREASLAREIAATDAELARSKSVLAETRKTIINAKLMSGDDSGSGAAVRYSILRRQPNGRFLQIGAIETTPVQPGDVVKVEMSRTGVDALLR